MNRFLELQKDIDFRQKRKAGEHISRKKETTPGIAQSLSNERYRVFDTPAYTFSTNPMNDEGERDEDLFSGSASVTVVVPSFCTLNKASDASTSNFKLVEFNCKDKARTPVPESIRGNVQQVMEQLEVLRSELNASITITSGYRTIEHNKSVGGESQSLHLCGMAADIKVNGFTPEQVHSTIEKLIVAGKMKQGGIGLYNSFVHYDIRGKKERWDKRDKAVSKSWYGMEMQAGYYDWPSKFGTGDAAYDEKAAAWVKENRDAITQHSGLKKTESMLGGYSYLGNPKKDPTADWQVTDPQHKKAYEAIREELKSEGGTSSINTYDDQIVTIGWGFSGAAGAGKDILKYNIAASTAFSNEILKAGLTAKDNDVKYLDTSSKKILSGNDAWQKLRWDAKTLTALINAMESYADINTASQVKVFKETKMKNVPAAVYNWPTDSVRLAIHLKHWLPVGIVWDDIKDSGGDAATIIKNFCKRLYAYQVKINKDKADKSKHKIYIKMDDLTSGALYVTDSRKRFDMGNKAFIKAGDAGTIKRILKADFTDSYKTSDTYKNYVFVEFEGTVYLLP